MQNDIEENPPLEVLYFEALNFTKAHYENFPVLSFFVPKKLRKYIAVVYQFARQADDIADEGNFTEDERLAKLEAYETTMQNSSIGKFGTNYWKTFNDTIIQNNLSMENFSNLLTAFKQDLSKKKYETYEEVLDYCKLSANPVGRIILELYKVKSNEAVKYSDAICTALQLTNFYQDVNIDFEKQREYLPQNQISKFSVNRNPNGTLKYSTEFINLMKSEITSTRNLFYKGRNILPFLPLRLKFQILVTIKGGEAILKKIENQNFDVLSERPKLNKADFIKIFLSAIFIRK